MNIGLSLSGGGYRATVFHLGVLARLAESQALEQITILSTVSGGSLCAGLLHGLNQMRWPTSQEYIEKIAPHAHHLLTTTDLQKDLIGRVLGSFWTLFGSRADDLSALIKQKWGITARLNELPDTPRWLINTTCYETGKNWRFEKYRVGDYTFGYSRDTAIPLSDAMAASAGFPVGIGPLEFVTTSRRWYKYTQGAAPILADNQEAAMNKQEIQPVFPKVHLWDGGVYDNHGLEGVHDFAKGWQLGIDFLVISDAAGRSKPEAYSWGPKAILRMMTGIMMDQIRSLRSRAIVERFINHEDKGIFLQTGNTCERIIRSAGRGKGLPQADINAQIAKICPGSLSAEEAQKAAEMPTVIRKLTEEEYELLFRHGFELADGFLYAYYSEDFDYIGYTKSRWARS
jgi:NTE family protein